MRSWPDVRRTILPPAWQPILPIFAMTAAGFGLTLRVFYPGVMTYDARYVYEDIAKGFYGDWQSPVMTALWSLIDPIAPGSGSMFLLMATLYWLAFGVLALTVARRSLWLALALLLLALSPPAFVFVGIIWRDVLFAIVWLFSAALAFAVAGRGRQLRIPVQVFAIGLLALGVLLRPNALLAAPVLGAYVLWPSRFSWKRAAIVYVPAVIALYALVQIVYYGALGATRQHPLHSIMVFDLGGITHFTKENQFPVVWSPAEIALLTGRCYQPTEWNIYWTGEPCRFVMARLEGEKIFGAPALVAAWARAVTRHPIAYLQHRAGFMRTFLAGSNFTLWTEDIDHPTKTVFSGDPAFMALKTVHDALKQTPLFRAGTWLLLNVLICGFAWRRRDTPAGAFAFGVCGSAVVYMMTFFAVGVAADFRYAYWAVLAGLTGAVAVIVSFRPSASR
jgi:hypothetical protein